MLNKEMSAGTKAEQSKNIEVTTSSPTIGNTNVVSTEKDSKKGYTIINQSTNQTISLDGQLVVYLGNRHIHMSGRELVDIILKKSKESEPKIGVRQQFGTLQLDENGQGKMGIAYGVSTENGIKFD